MFSYKKFSNFNQQSLMDEIICMNTDRNMSLLISNDNLGNSISRQQTFVEPFFEYPSSVHMNPENCLLVLSQVDQNSKNINQSEVFKRSKIFILNPFSEVNILVFIFTFQNIFTNN